MRYLSFLIFLVCVQTKANNFFENLLSQTVAQPIIEEQKQYIITPAVGLGGYSNSLSFDSLDLLQNTNSSFYIIGLDINGYSSHVFIPYRDNSDRRRLAVDSDVFRFQSGFKVTPEFYLEAIYSKVIGFYQGNYDDPKSPIFKYPDLGLKKFSLIGTYMFDPTHRTSLFSPISYSAVPSGQSMFLSFELNQNDLSGLADLNSKLPVADQKTDSIQSAKAISLLASFGFSQAKMYQNFFWSYAIGFGLGPTYVEKNYLSRTAKDSLITTTVPISGQIGWNEGTLTTGLFATIRSWAATLDQFKLSNSNGNSGLFLAYQF